MDWEQMPHPIRLETLAMEDAQSFCKLLQNALPVNENIKMLCHHVLKGHLSSER